jgi:hypothetical protein
MGQPKTTMAEFIGASAVDRKTLNITRVPLNCYGETQKETENNWDLNVSKFFFF